MSRYGVPRGATVQFGPGPVTRAVRALIIANVAVFVITSFGPLELRTLFGLVPELVFTRGWVWQPVTYAFLHHDVFHILFNMLVVWMFGVDLERTWGTAAFTKFYFVCAIAAGATVLIVSLLPFDSTRAMFGAVTIGASGACYGLLMAWAVLFPRRQLLLFFLFPVEVRYAVLIFGAIAFFSGLGAGDGYVAHFAHLGGLIAGYLYLRGVRGLRYSVQSGITRMRFARARRKFTVHEGRRQDDARNKRGGWTVH